MKIISLISCVIISATLCAQPVKLENTMLWKIQKSDLSKEAYIFFSGPTCTNDIKPDRSLDSILKEVHAIVLEYALYDPKEAYKLQAANIAQAASQRVKSVLSLTQYGLLTNYLTSHDIPDQFLARISRYRISFFYYLLLAINSPCGGGLEDFSYEPFFRKYSKSNNIKLSVLENTDEFIGEQEMYPVNYWEKNILFFLKNDMMIGHLLQTELSLYKKESLSGLKRLYKNEFFEKRVSAAIYANHIQLLGDKIENAVDTDKCLIVLNILNVVGDNANILDVLMKKGYLISPL